MKIAYLYLFLLLEIKEYIKKYLNPKLAASSNHFSNRYKQNIVEFTIEIEA